MLSLIDIISAILNIIQWIDFSKSYSQFLSLYNQVSEETFHSHHFPIQTCFNSKKIFGNFFVHVFLTLTVIAFKNEMHTQIVLERHQNAHFQTVRQQDFMFLFLLRPHIANQTRQTNKNFFQLSNLNCKHF